MKKYHCCIPGCTTYDTLNNFLTIPPDSEARAKWLSVVSRKDWVVDNSTMACYQHFKKSDFYIVNMSLKNSLGKERIVRTINAVEHKIVIPSVTPQVNNAYTDQDFRDTTLPGNMYVLDPIESKPPEIFEDIENGKNDDFVNEFWYITMSYKERLKIFLEQKWQCFANAEYILFYIIDFSPVPRISISVKIDSSLRVTVTLDGRFMDLADLTWVLPVTGKLNRWSQLQLMLKVYGN